MATTDLAYETSGVISAGPEAVVRWWLHPDRQTEYRHRIEAAGARDLSFEVSVADGTRIRTIEYTDQASWKHRNVMQSPLLSGGSPEPLGDRLVLPVTAVRTYASPVGGRLVSTCNCRTEFIPVETGTEVLAVHNHSLSGMSRRRQRRKGTAERTADEEAFAETLARCRDAMVQGPGTGDQGRISGTSGAAMSDTADT